MRIIKVVNWFPISLRTISKSLCTMSSKQSSLYVEPYKSLLDQPVHISGEGFESNTKITIQSILECQEEKLHFESYGHYLTSDNGCFDLNKIPSLGGTFEGLDVSGLFWSMKKLKGSRDVASLKDARAILDYTFNVYNGHLNDFKNMNSLVSKNVIKCVMKDGIYREEIAVGKVRGTLFSPDTKGKYPAIITIHGGNKMNHVIEDYAGYLANHGFASLALSYFGVEGLPKKYTDEPIQIEYFEEAINYLKSLDFVNGKIGILGRSKGGDIALGMMAHLTNIDAVCVINTAITSIGCDTTYKGHRTKGIQGALDRAIFNEDGVVDISKVMDDPRNHPDQIHQFQHSTADLFIIAGQEDLNWQTELYVDIAREMMDSVGKSNYEIIKYPNSGHFFDIPNSPIVTVCPHILLPKGMIMDFGGGKNKFMFNKEIVDAWKRIIQFFKKSLNGPNSKL